MNFPDRAKLSRMTTVAKSLKDAASASYENRRFKNAASLYARADIAESRARDFELEAMFPDVDAKADFTSLFDGGRPLL